MLAGRASASERRTALRAGLSSGRLLRFPGAFNALSALLVEQAGFEGVYVSGAVVSASLGLPDIGLTTASEVAGFARETGRVSSLPSLVDADTGFGEAMNTARTVQLLEEAGASACHLEDQVMPKRCGHLDGKAVVPVPVMRQRLAAALGARGDPDFVICARTDARAVEGLERAIERGQMYRRAGADVIFVEAPQSEAEIEAVAQAFPGVPLLFNWAEGGKTPPVSLERLRELGFRIVLFPISTLLAATAAVRRVLARIRADGTPAAALGELTGFADFVDFMGLPEVRELEHRFGGLQTTSR